MASKTVDYSMLRSESRHKWYTLACLCTLWTASYHCILCQASLETQMLQTLHLSNTQFALFSTLSFVFAMFASLWTPHIIKQINLYNASFLSCVLVTVGQSVFMVGVAIPVHVHISVNLAVLYTGRILIGFGYGIQNVTVYSTINVWFRHSMWLSFAFSIINTTFTLGILTTRYSLVPLYQATHLLYLPYSVGVAMCVISAIACICMSCIEKRFQKQCELTETDVSIDLDNDFTKMKHFKLDIWLIMALIVIGWAATETFGSQITEPCIAAFGISEEAVNGLVGMQSIFGLATAPIWGWLASKYGHLTHLLISSTVFLSLAMALLFEARVFQQMPPVVGMAVVLILWAIGVQQFFAVCITCLSLICPLELLSIANSVVSIGFMIGSAVEAWLFGAIADATNSYQWSILMMISWTLTGTVIAVIMHLRDVCNNGPLRSAKCNDSAASEGGSTLETDDFPRVLETVQTEHGEHTPLLS